MGYTKRTQQEWLELYEAWQITELSAAAFCREEDVGYQGFQNFRKRYEAGEIQQIVTQEPSPTFIDVAALTQSTGQSLSTWKITLRLGNGVELELGQSV